MKKDHVILIILFFLTYGFADTQTTDDLKAREYFNVATTYLNKGDYLQAVNNFDKAIELLGKTNIRIQPLLIKSLVSLKEYTRASREYEVYLSLKPDPALVEYLETTTLKQTIDEKIQKEESDYLITIHSTDDSIYIKFLFDYPYSKYVNDVKECRDGAAYKRATTDNTWEGYWKYIDDYSAGKNRDKAKLKITELELAAFKFTSADNSIQAWESYIKKYARGTMLQEAKKKLAEAKEYSLYKLTLNQTEDKPFADYLSSYPNGRYAQDSRNGRDDAAYARARKPNTWESIWAYIDAFPSGRHANEAREIIRVSDNRFFSEATTTNTLFSYDYYIKTYWRGQHVTEARAKQEQLRATLAAMEKQKKTEELNAEISKYSSTASGKYFLGGIELVGGLGLVYAVYEMSFGSLSTSDSVLKYPAMGAAVGFAPFLFIEASHNFKDGAGYSRLAKESKDELSRLSFSIDVSNHGNGSSLKNVDVGFSIKVPLDY